MTPDLAVGFVCLSALGKQGGGFGGGGCCCCDVGMLLGAVGCWVWDP